MLENLGEELARIVTIYKNRASMFRWNSGTPFSLTDIVRHFLFTRAEAAGYTPIPNLAVLDWTIDLACLKGYRLERLFMVRESVKEDYRQLLLFPRSVEKVLIAMTHHCIPKDRTGLHIVEIPKRPTQQIRRTLSVRMIRQEFYEAFNEIYGIEPLLSQAQSVGVASRVAAFWNAHGGELEFKEYCVWLFRRLIASPRPENEIPSFHEVLDRDALQAFRLEKRRADEQGEWTGAGWSGLGS